MSRTSVSILRTMRLLLPGALTVVLLTACGTTDRAVEAPDPATSIAAAGEVADASRASNTCGAQVGDVLVETWIPTTVTVRNPSPNCTLTFELNVSGRGGAKCNTKLGEEWFGKPPGPVFRSVAPGATQTFPTSDLFPEWGKFCDNWARGAIGPTGLHLGYSVITASAYEASPG